MNKKLLKEFIQILETLDERGREDKSPAAQDAARKGLKHVGYGNYADPKTQKVTHRSVHGKLEPVAQQKQRKAKTDGGKYAADQNTKIKNFQVPYPSQARVDLRNIAKNNKTTAGGYATNATGANLDKGAEGAARAIFDKPSPYGISQWDTSPQVDKDVTKVVNTLGGSVTDKARAAFRLYKKAEAQRDSEKAARYKDLAIGLIKFKKNADARANSQSLPKEQPIEDNPEVDQNYPYQPEPYSF